MLITNKLIANAIASFVFSFIVIDAAIAVYRVQQLERNQQSECGKQGYSCSRIYLFDFMDGDILAFSASGVALLGVGLSSLVLNRNPTQNAKTNIAMYLLSVSFFGTYAVYYNIFSYAQYYWLGLPAPLMPGKSILG
jgi:hypothetical protein